MVSDGIIAEFGLCKPAVRSHVAPSRHRNDIRKQVSFRQGNEFFRVTRYNVETTRPPFGLGLFDPLT